MDSFRIALPDIVGARLIVQGKHGEMVISSSAYDVPKFMDVQVNRVTHTLRLDFGYLDQEASRPQRLDEDFTVYIGVNSGKLLAMEARNLSKNSGEIVVGLTNSVERQLEHATRDNQKINYAMIKDVVQNQLRNRLSPLLAG